VKVVKGTSLKTLGMSHATKRRRQQKAGPEGNPQKRRLTGGVTKRKESKFGRGVWKKAGVQTLAKPAQKRVSIEWKQQTTHQSGQREMEKVYLGGG